MTAMDKSTEFTCCICEKKSYGYGNNPEPVKPTAEGCCCDACNIDVIAARLKRSLDDKNS